MHVLAALGTQAEPLSKLAAAYSRYAASGEINSTVLDVVAATERVREWAAARGATFDELDGLSATKAADADGPMWWLNLRASNTEPLLRLNVEADDEETLTEVRDDVLALVRGEG
jgi:phosphomannomutase